MKWRFDDLRTFLDVLDAGSITAAAARLNLAKSVVSKRVADLEAALGAALFHRSAGRLAPTETGLRLAERVRPLVGELDAAAEAAAWGLHGLRGRLAVTAPVTFATLHLGPVIGSFARNHPDLELRLDYDDRMVDLVRGGFDVGIRVGPPRDASLIARRLCDDARVVVASPDLLARHGIPGTPADLARFPAVDYSHMSAAALWQFETAEGPAAVTADSRFLANNGEAMRDLAVAGLGIAMLPMFIVAPALADGRLIRLLPEARTPPLPVSAVWPPSKPVAPKVRAFVDHLAAAFAPAPPWLGGQRPRGPQRVV